MVLLILESLGSTELVFILVMALVFFGPRKLPQISRSLGKNLAEFRRASEEFKRTWDREATLDDSPVASGSTLAAESSLVDPETPGHLLEAPSVVSVSPDQVIARNTLAAELPYSAGDAEPAAGPESLESFTDEPKHSPKNDWL